MNSWTRIAVAAQAPGLPFLNAHLSPVFSLRGVRKLVPHLKQGRRLRGRFSKNMAYSLENCDFNVENKLGIVHPATDDYAAEAVEALKAGKVIAVPTDTLYGFACDAWYAI